MNVTTELRALLCDPSGKVAIDGSDEDRLAIQSCLLKVERMEAFVTEVRSRERFMNFYLDNKRKINDSDILLALCEDTVNIEAEMALQMGIAVYMDKPIGALVAEGQKVPRNVQKVANFVEQYKPDEIQAAAGRLSQKLRNFTGTN